MVVVVVVAICCCAMAHDIFLFHSNHTISCIFGFVLLETARIALLSYIYYVLAIVHARVADDYKHE